MHRSVNAAVVGIAIAGGALAQEIEIQSFHSTGELTWSNSASGAWRYRVEWAPTLGGPWTNTWDDLGNIVTGATPCTVQVPMCYRVIGSPVGLPTNALVAFYPFNGSANDASGKGHHGVVHGATSTQNRFGDANSAYQFDGVDDYIDCGDPANGDFDFGENEDLSVSCWIKTTMTPSWYPFIYAKDWHVPGSNNGRIGYELLLGNDATAVFEIWVAGVADSPRTTFTINDGAWHHIVTVRDGNQGILYVDGSVVSTQTCTTASLATSTPLYSGKHDVNPTFDEFLGASMISESTEEPFRPMK